MPHARTARPAPDASIAPTRASTRALARSLARALALAVVLAATSATAWVGPGIATAAAAAPPACPAAPTRVTRSAGGVIDYLGTVPGVPDLCRMRRADGAGDFYFGSWRSDWPGAGLAYPVIRAVVTGGTGARGSFVTRSYPGLQYTDSFVNEGVEPVTVGGRVHQALRLAHERQGIEGNTYHSVITAWRDAETAVVLKVEERQIAGQSYGPDTTWHALSVGPPP